jgi:hypothetical protein
MFELIHRYSRADAIRDGVLIDVSETARAAGIRYPVALTLLNCVLSGSFGHIP